MYTVIPFDNKIPQELHEAVYEYLQTCDWHARFRHVPDSNDYKKDLEPYIAKKTAYRVSFGTGYESLQEHTPIAALFDYINKALFGNKFELVGKPLGMLPVDAYPEKEFEDCLADRDLKGSVAFMQAEPFETVKRSRVPNRDWDSSSLDSDRFYTITFVANLKWNPVWHSEVFYYEDNDSWLSTFTPNIPGRVMLHDSRVLHTEKPTSVLAEEPAQRINFRVKLKEGETLDL